jgi:hypothetical protein
VFAIPLPPEIGPVTFTAAGVGRGSVVVVGAAVVVTAGTVVLGSVATGGAAVGSTTAAVTVGDAMSSLDLDESEPEHAVSNITAAESDRTSEQERRMREHYEYGPRRHHLDGIGTSLRARGRRRRRS